MTHFFFPYRLFLALAVVCSISFAPLAEGDETPTFQTTVDTGYTQLDEDGFVFLSIHQHIMLFGARLHLNAPLRFRVFDQSPTEQMGLRRQDWDEAADFGRIVPKLYFERLFPEGHVSLSIGNISHFIMGKSTIIAHFFNNLELDHYKPGIVVSGGWRGSGATLILDNLIRPTVIGARIHLAPATWFSTRKSARIVEIAATLAADPTAPFIYYETGTHALLTAGGELVFHCLQHKKNTLDIYTAAMAMDGDGGFHIGVDTAFELSDAKLVLGLQGEYRYVGSDYHPALFNPFYEKNRYFFLGSDSSPISLADHMSHETNLPSRHGAMVEGEITWHETLAFGIRYDREGQDRPHWLITHFTVRPHKGYNFRLFYGGYDPTGGKRLIGFNNLMALAFRAKLVGPLDIVGHISRSFRRQNRKIQYENDILGGLGVAVSY